jgi:orotidine 5''-phosphate decarboxylase, subfamily 1
MFNVKGCWLTPGEQDEAIEALWQSGLLKCDNGHKLPLKSGGTTDIYVNLRMMRSDPAIMNYLALLFANPLRRLRLDRFVEVPEAVSPMAGLISSLESLPMVTIREEVKQGRVSGGMIVGDLKSGDRVAIIDDVITDGASKIPALTVLRDVLSDVAALVVLVDRQQGWAKKLPDSGFCTPVWPAMTLHDIRRYLIRNNMMQRCDPKVEEDNPIIVALDGKQWDDVLPLLDSLRTSGCIWKVNDLMLDRGLAWILPNLSVYGRVMVDLKGHDIPNTIANICKRLRPCPPWAVTVHASGGMEMVTAAVLALAGTGTKVLAVTVLTSLAESDCKDIYGRAPMDQVMHLAMRADSAGADGFVCSPEEVGILSSMPWGKKKLFVTPGIRSAGVASGDQQRIGTPKAAMEAGATHLVIGRQILESADPVAEVMRIRQEIL